MNHKTRSWARALAAAAAVLVLPSYATAQAFPAKPITLIVPFAPGGGTDSIARDIGKKLAERLGQPVVVENRGGAGGALGADAVAKAKPDGHTLLFATSTFATNAAVAPRLAFSPDKDFAPVAMIGRGPLLAVASRELGVQTIAQAIEAGNKRREGLNYCSAGEGSINHLTGEMFRQKTGLNLTHVPFKGSAPATVELLSGRIDLFFATVPTILQFAKDGRVVVMAVTSARRSPLFPDVPTMAEAGLPGFDVTTWWGILAPAGTPQAVVDLLNKTVNEAAATKAVKERLLHEGADPVKLTPAGFGKELDRELVFWRAIAANPSMRLR